MGHMFFWFSSIATGLIQAASLVTGNSRRRRIFEFALTAVNVATFMIVYFCLDIQLLLEEQLLATLITEREMNGLLQISHFPETFRDFIADPARVFILAGGSVLSLSPCIGRCVDKNVRDRILSGEEETHSESKEAAILFSDIRNFTSLSENETP